MDRKNPRGELHDQLVREIVLAVSKTGYGRCWEQPTGAAYRGRQLIHYGLVGCADISGILKGGYRLEIEVKTGRGVLRESQRNFRQMILNHVGLYIEARSVHDAIFGIEEFLKGRGVL